MKLLLIGGISSSLVNFRLPIIHAAHARGHTVYATAKTDSDESVRALGSLGVRYAETKVERAGLGLRSDLAYLRALIALIEEVKPDAILAYTHKPIIYSGIAAHISARDSKVCALITGLGFAFTTGAGARRAIARVGIEFLYRTFSSRFDSAIFQNRDDAAHFRNSRLIPLDTGWKIVRGSGVDLRQFSFAPVPASRPGVRFLMVGRMLRDKGVVEYVEAARMLKSEGHPVEFDLVGPVDENPSGISLRQLERWSAEGTINYFGPQKDVRPFLARCSVFVLPSYREGTPRTVLEAMAVGRAVVTTDTPGCRETVFGVDAHGVGENGILVSVGSARALYEAMKQFVVEPRLIGRMGRCGRRLAEEHYDATRVAQDIVGMLDGASANSHVV